MGNAVFCLCWLLIGIVSAIDAALTVKYVNTIRELNPLALQIMREFGVHSLVAAKMIGTVVTLGVLALLMQWRRPWGLLSAAGVAVCQVALLGFLLWA